VRPDTKFDVDYFIKKFEAIPDEQWTTNAFVSFNAEKKIDTSCAFGHCGAVFQFQETSESSALYHLGLSHNIEFDDVNDDVDSRYQQSTPKERVLAALADIKEGKI
jgi:hypothetical protein